MIVKKINNLALDIQKTPYRYWLNIMKKLKDSTSYYVILGFEYDEEYDIYKIESTLDRLDDKTIDWFDLGILINLGYDLLNKDKRTLEEIYKDLLEKGKEE